MDMFPFLELRGVSFAYHRGNNALESIDLTLTQGAFLSIMGPNGAGKTTLLKILAGILRPDQGTVRLLGVEIQPTSRTFERFAYVPQFLLFPMDLRVIDFVLLARTGSTLTGQVRAWDVKKAFEALERVGCLQFWNQDVSHLSGGERQKVFLAKALAQDTPVLLIDEPVTHLDLKNQEEILCLLQSLVREEGKKIVAVMHDLNHARQYTDTVVLLKGGKLCAAGPSSEVLTPTTIGEVFDVEVEDRSGWIVPRLKTYGLQ